MIKILSTISLLANIDDKKAYLAQTFGQKLKDAAKKDTSAKKKDPASVVDQLLAADPTKGKHLQWIVRMYTTGQFRMEDVARLKGDLVLFEKHRVKIPNKDLNSYKSLDELYDVTEPLAEKPVDLSKSQQEQEAKKEVVRLIDTPHFKAIIPKSEKAACLYGKGTKWCTSADENNAFDEYASKGDLVIIMTKLGGKDRKFQLHPDTEQYMNERDQPISRTEIAALSKIPEYTQLLNMLIEKHYGHYFKD